MGFDPHHGFSITCTSRTAVLEYSPMKHEPAIFDVVDEAADARRAAEALADVAAGRLISNDEVCAWLGTWGTPDEQPAPAAWFE